MKKVVLLIAAVLFLFSSGLAVAQQGKGKEKGPNESAYQHADEKAKFLRDDTETATER